MASLDARTLVTSMKVVVEMEDIGARVSGRGQWIGEEEMLL